MLTWQGTGGFSVDASVRIHGSGPGLSPSAGHAHPRLPHRPGPVGAIVRCLDLPHTAPRLSPARAPPQAALELDTDPVAPVDPIPADDFDQTPAFNPIDPEHLTELDLDQTRGA